MKRICALVILYLFTVCIAEGAAYLDLNEVETDWDMILQGAAVCKPVAIGDGVAVLMDGRQVVFITEKGKVKWQTRIKGKGAKSLANLIPLGEDAGGLIAAASGNTISLINCTGRVLWSTFLSHNIESVCVTPNGIEAIGEDTKKANGAAQRKDKGGGHSLVRSEKPFSILGIKGKIKQEGSALFAKSNKKQSKDGADTLPRHIILPPEADDAFSYTVMTSGGYLLLFEKSWRVRAWHIALSPSHIALSPSIEKKDYEGEGEGIDIKEDEAISRLKDYISTLTTLSREKRKPTVYSADILSACKMFHSAAEAEAIETPSLFALAIREENNFTLLTALFKAAGEQSFDDGTLLDAIGKRAKRISGEEDGTLIALLDAVTSICLFMGGEGRTAEGISILRGVLDSHTSIKVSSHCRKCLAALGRG